MNVDSAFINSFMLLVSALFLRIFSLITINAGHKHWHLSYVWHPVNLSGLGNASESFSLSKKKSSPSGIEPAIFGFKVWCANPLHHMRFATTTSNKLDRAFLVFHRWTVLVIVNPNFVVESAKFDGVLQEVHQNTNLCWKPQRYISWSGSATTARLQRDSRHAFRWPLQESGVLLKDAKFSDDVTKKCFLQWRQYRKFCMYVSMKGAHALIRLVKRFWGCTLTTLPKMNLGNDVHSYQGFLGWVLLENALSHPHTHSLVNLLLSHWRHINVSWEGRRALWNV